jgi:hypothetical protein
MVALQVIALYNINYPDARETPREQIYPTGTHSRKGFGASNMWWSKSILFHKPYEI